LLLDLQGDGLPGPLQEADGLAQRLSFQAHAVDGQDPVPDVDGPGPAGTRRRSYQSTPRGGGVILRPTEAGTSERRPGQRGSLLSRIKRWGGHCLPSKNRPARHRG